MPDRLAAVVGLVAAFLVGWVPPALAKCVGQDLMVELRSTDPAGHDEILARAREFANSEGRFWKIERDGTRPSYLFGTFHTEDALDYVPPEIWPALEGSDVVVFELDSNQVSAMETRMMSDPTFMFDPSATPLSQRVPPDVLKEIRAALTERGVPGPLGEQMRPWMLFSLLSFPVCHIQAQMQGAEPLDRHLSDRALELGIREIGLETYEEALAVFKRTPIEEMMSLMTAQSLQFDREEDLFATNLGFYARGNVGAVLEFGLYMAEKEMPGVDIRDVQERFLDELLVARNIAWMPALLREIRRGNAFVGVGALHLAGDAGLIELLRAEGYTVTLIAH